MGSSSLSILKTIALGISVVAIMAIGQGVAKAGAVTVVGSSTGVVTRVPALTVVGNGFDATTALGIGALSGISRLGTFTLAVSPTRAVAGNFYLANITGSASPVVDQGGVAIHFKQPVIVFTLDNGGIRTAMPEPASMLLLGTGLLGVAGVARRRLRHKQ